MRNFINVLFASIFMATPMYSESASLDGRMLTIEATSGKINFVVPKGYENAISPGGNGFWIYFKYPSITPIKPSDNQKPDVVSLLVRFGNPATPSISEMTLQSLQWRAKNARAEYLGDVNGFDTFSQPDTTGEKKFTYFAKQTSGELICFQEILSKIDGTRQFGKFLELRYIFNKSLFAKKMDIDEQVVLLVGRMTNGEIR